LTTKAPPGTIRPTPGCSPFLTAVRSEIQSEIRSEIQLEIQGGTTLR